MNRNDRIISDKDIIDQMDFDSFEDKDKFSFLCDLVAEKKRERLVIQNANPDLIEKRGVLYIFVLDNKLVKIGSTTTSFWDRVQSYNCGKKAYRTRGTCSTTNFFVLQSLLNINKIVKVYGFFPGEIELDVFGERERISLPAKRFEKKLLTLLKKKGTLPIMCTQR